jgi:hypothetical protein
MKFVVPSSGSTIQTLLAQSGVPFNGPALRVNMPRLSAQDGVAREGPEKRFDNRVLGGPIDLGYKVVGLFTGNANGVDIKRRSGE